MIRFGEMQVAEQNIKDDTREEFDKRFKGKIAIPLDEAWQIFCKALGRDLKEAPKKSESLFSFNNSGKKKNKKNPPKDKEGS